MGDESNMKDMIDLFQTELELCKVGPDEKLAVLSEDDVLADYAEAFLMAAANLGAETKHVNLHPQSSSGTDSHLSDLSNNPLKNDPDSMQILKQVDMVVDLIFLLFSAEQIEIQQAGTRMLLVVEPFEILKRLFPTEEIRLRVEAGERRIHAAKTLRFTSKAGTDVVYELAELKGPPPECVLTEYGYTDTPGRWDHWPSGFIATTATVTGVAGKVVMDAGDLVLPQKKALSAPLEFIIEQGMITQMNGEEDASWLKDYMDSFDDPRAFAVSHIGWGLNEAALWDVNLPGICMDGRAYYGNVLFSTGPNTEFGSKNDTACHLDLPMKNCSLWLDDELIVSEGEVIPEDLRAPAR